MIAKPTVHLGGTSKKELMEQLENANTAIQNAIWKLEIGAPNARDYDLFATADSYHRAQAQHIARCEKLRGVHQELCSVWEHVADQGESPARGGASGEVM